jgi:hypothetical protein
VHTAVPYSRRHFCKRDCLRTPREGDFYLLLAPGLTTCITASGQMTADRVSRETQQETGALVPLDQQRTLFRSAERTPREGRGTCKSMHAPLLLYAPHSCVTSTTSSATPLGVSSSSHYISTRTRPATTSEGHRPGLPAGNTVATDQTANFVLANIQCKKYSGYYTKFGTSSQHLLSNSHSKTKIRVRCISSLWPS